MSNTDQQTEKSAELAESAMRVSDRVEIRGVVLVSAKLARGDVREGTNFDVKIRRSARAKMDASRKLLIVQVEIGFTARADSELEKPPSVEAWATYELTYSVPDQTGLTQEHFDAFAEMNGVFNAWPYFREFLHSSLSRMGLPPFTLPVLRIGAAVRSRSPESAKSMDQLAGETDGSVGKHEPPELSK